MSTAIVINLRLRVHKNSTCRALLNLYEYKITHPNNYFA